MPLLRVPSHRFVGFAGLIDGGRRHFRARAPPDTRRLFHDDVRATATAQLDDARRW
jgi:hypothetical protein